MPQSAGVKQYNSFVKGLITESSALSFPENASIDEENFLLNRNGSRQRRLGMDYESGYSLVDTGQTTLTFDNYTLSTFRWDNPSGNSNLSIGVVQVGNKLWFVDLFASALSANLLNGGSSITVGVNGQRRYDMDSVNGDLIVVTGEGAPLQLEYDSGTDTVSSSTLSLHIRDLFGVDDGLDINERPATLSAEHKYNLFNQGWTLTNINAVFSSLGAYPSNADIQYLGKDGSDNFSASLLNKQYFGNTPAPRGHYILDAFTRGASRGTESGLSLPADEENGYVSCVASYAGRIFYAGIESNVSGGDANSPNYTGYVFFSSVVQNNGDLQEALQEADPTSEHISDLIDTDGGFIVIPGANNIYRIVAIQESLVVIAENGIWQIFGGDAGFRATEYQVSKITGIGAVNAEAVVEAEGSVFYWSKGGIYVLAPDPVTKLLAAQNVTETTIQTLFSDIPGIGKLNAVGSYDTTNKKISWLYNDDDAYNGVSLKNKYNKELVFDTVLGAFYKNSIGEVATNSPYIAGYMTTPNFATFEDTQNLVVNGEQVQVNGEDVVVTQNVRGRGSGTTKYLTILPASGGTYSFTFSHYNDNDFKDWQTKDGTGVNYSSYLITGYETGGDLLRHKQVPYILFYFNRTEDGFTGSGDTFDLSGASSCLVQSRWDWSDHANSGKFGSEFQAYRLKRNYIPDDISDPFDYGYEVITTKSKLRGRGRALSLKISSEEGKDMHLLGWAMMITGGTAV